MFVPAIVGCSAVKAPGTLESTTSGGGSQPITGAGGQGDAMEIVTGVGAGGSDGSGCSPDLRAVTDSDGLTLKTCPPEQGCAGGQCVPACQAAAQSRGSIGCDFLAPDPPFYNNGISPDFYGPCYAVFVANTWSRPAHLSLSRGGQTFDVTELGYTVQRIAASTQYTKLPSSGLPPNEVAVLFLSHQPGVSNAGFTLECPVPPGLLSDAAVEGSGLGSAFHLTSDTPITAYDILPYGGANSFLPSASLLYPSTAWGTNYYAVAPRADLNGQSWALIVGAVDGTKVTIAAANTLPGGGGLAPATAGQSDEFVVDAGQTLQWIGADPTGSILRSTQPIGLFTGNTYLKVASATSPGGGGKDSAHQQLQQITALGSEYVAPGIVTRLPSLAPESVPYQLMGVVDGTQLTWDPAPPPGAPLTLAAGQMVEVETTAIFTVKAQDGDHPFSFMQYMPGAPGSGTRPGCGTFMVGKCALGDEEWVNLVAPRQFLQHYVFFTDPTYATTNLVVTRVKGKKGFSDVTIDCLGAPISTFKPVGAKGDYEVAYVDLVRGGVPVAQCDGSRHEATSKGPFGVMVWGTDYQSSYGYPAGGNLSTINTIAVPPIPK